jgi:sialate O-acetylesterase
MVLALVLAPAVPAAPPPPPVLAPLFSDGAVLQQGVPVPVWGRAAAGEHVTVAYAGQAVGATAGPDGRWIAVLGPLDIRPAGADLVVTGRGTATVHDVCVGEVWVCAGGSNMALTLRESIGRGGASAAEAAGARLPLLRGFRVAPRAAADPEESAGGAWRPCTPASAGGFSAIGFLFARDLLRRLGTPIGLIEAAVPDSTLEAWMSPEALAHLPGSPAPAAGRGEAARPAALFNGMIHPLLPYALRGVLWYQGEADVGRPAAYAQEFPAMISAWRSHLGEGDFPFLWVQLANFRPAGDARGSPWALLREAQAKALALPGTAQAVAIDIGDPASPVPADKHEVARRLALIAKARVYGIAVDWQGPTLVSALPSGSALRLLFATSGEGLTAAGKPLQAFEVAGADRSFHPASASIESDALLVRSPRVGRPVAVRYAWANDPDANLYDGAGLPAAPFRTDAW